MKAPLNRAERNARVAIAIMAAGKGTRLKSKHPKVLHEVGGKPLLAHVIAAAEQVVPPRDIWVIVGHEAEKVRESVQQKGVQFVLQEPQRGTGHALMCAAPVLAKYEQVIVLSGDAPLITAETIAALRDFHLQKKAGMTILSARLEDPTGYGRVIRDGGDVKMVVEEKSATPAQKKIREINSGFYAFSAKALLGNIEWLKTDNPHGEYYLTDMAAALRKAKQRVAVIQTSSASEILGSNTRAELVDLDRKMRQEKCRQLMTEGVTIFYPDTCVMDWEVHMVGGTIGGDDDGVHKHETSVVDGVFAGSDAPRVARASAGKGAYIAAASGITEDVPPDSPALGRAKQVVKEGWANAKRANK